MSHSTLYAVTKDLGYESIKSYGNSWGSHPVIWEYYSKIEGFGPYMSGFGVDGKGFWENYDERLNNEETPISERLVIALTYYPVAIHRSCFDELRKGLIKISKIYNETYNNERINHLESIAKDLEELDKKYDFICLKGTSCDDLYEFWDHEIDEEVTNLNKLKVPKLRKDFDFAFIEDGRLVYKKLLEKQV